MQDNPPDAVLINDVDPGDPDLGSGERWYPPPRITLARAMVATITGAVTNVALAIQELLT